jgi:hypothetical protein
MARRKSDGYLIRRRYDLRKPIAALLTLSLSSPNGDAGLVRKYLQKAQDRRYEGIGFRNIRS